MNKKVLAFLTSCVVATALIGGIVSKVTAENINTFTPSSTNYVNFLSAPAKRLKASIGPADMSFQLSDVKGWDGNALTSSSFGGDAYVVFHNDAGTAYEIMQIDPTTIGSSAITILKRGMQFNGDLSISSSSLELTWVKNTTIVELGTDVPQLLAHAVQVGGDQTIAGLKTFVTTPQSNGTVSNTTDLTTKAYVDALIVGGGVSANNIVPGISFISNSTQLLSSTATGTYNGNPYYYSVNAGSVASTSRANSIPLTNASGTLDPSFVSGTAYTFTNPTINGGSINNATLSGVPGLTQYFGDGSNGSTTIASGSTTTASSDLYYSNLTVNGTLNMNGWRLFVNGTLNGTGTIMQPTPNAGLAGSGSTGGVAPTSSIAGFFTNIGGVAGGNSASGCGGGNGGAGSGKNVSSSIGSVGQIGLHQGNNGCASGGGVVTPQATGTQMKFGLSAYQSFMFIDFYPSGSTFVQIQGNTLPTSGDGGPGSGAGSPGTPGGSSAASTVPIFIAANTMAGTFTIKDTGANGGSPNGGASNGGDAIIITNTNTWTGSYNLVGGLRGGDNAQAAAGTIYSWTPTHFTNP